jgi:hypothetical protein
VWPISYSSEKILFNLSISYLFIFSILLVFENFILIQNFILFTFQPLSLKEERKSLENKEKERK